VSDPQVLLVDDSVEDCELMIRALQGIKSGLRVSTAHDGEEAIEYLFCKGRYAGRDKKSTPLLTLLDLKMPRVGGLEVLGALRADPMLRHLPVIVLTSSDEEGDGVEAQKMGVLFYFRKPLDFDGYLGLARRIHGMLPDGTEPKDFLKRA
jgi:two-component system, response regulator